MEEKIAFIVNDTIYDVPQDKLQVFLNKYPKAKKYNEPGKITPTTPGAVVEETVAPASQSTDLDLVNTSSGLTPGEQLSQ